MIKKIWAHEFHDAYEKSLKIKFKFSKHDTAQDRRETDVKGTQLNRQSSQLAREKQVRYPRSLQGSFRLWSLWRELYD